MDAVMRGFRRIWLERMSAETGAPRLLTGVSYETGVEEMKFGDSVPN